MEISFQSIFLDNSIIEGGEVEGWMSPLETPGNANQLRT